MKTIYSSFEFIIEHAHAYNWAPEWELAYKIYQNHPNSYSVLTPFAYTYLEEVIRSTTSEYGREYFDKNKNVRFRKVGLKLIELAIHENNSNTEYVSLLSELKSYFKTSSGLDEGDNRNSVSHGYMHPLYWSKESFEKLINDIKNVSRFARF